MYRCAEYFKWLVREMPAQKNAGHRVKRSLEFSDLNENYAGPHSFS